MNFALLLPVGLAALAAALLPFLIHLARRSEQRPTVFAALQWLRRKPKPRHRIRFDEWPLLLVRLLLLALLALLLARPALHGAHDHAPWIVVAPGAEVPDDRAPLAPAHARWHRLEQGFPAFDAAALPATLPPARASVTSLLRELDATLPPGVALTVLVPPVLDGVDGERPRLSRRVEWRVVPATAGPAGDSARTDVAHDARRSPTAASGTDVADLPQPAEGQAQSTEPMEAGHGGRDTSKASDAVQPSNTAKPAHASNESGASDPAKASKTPAPPRMTVRFAPDREPALRYLRAAFAAWSPVQAERSAAQALERHDIAPVAAPLPDSAHHLVWLAPGALPESVCDWVRSGGTALIDAEATPCAVAPTVALWRDEAGAPFVEAAAHGRGRMLRFTRELAPQSMPVLLDGVFPTALRALFETAASPPARVPAAAHAPLAGGARYAQPPRELAPWLIVLIALVFVIERTMATARRQGAAP